MLRFAAAAEILEADFWIQYNELGGVQDDEVPGGTGNEGYTEAIEVLDEDMPIYIHDNTDDEITHHSFLNAYLASKGAAPVNLEPFRTLPGSAATGTSGILRLTNLMQLTVDTSWWTRYRIDNQNPDLDPNFTFPQAVPTLGVGQHTAIPRTDADTSDPNFLQAIANTAAFHFATIEQGGNSLYPSMALRATHEEVLRILIILGSKPSYLFDHSTDRNKRCCHAHSAVPNGHGAFHRPVSGVLCVYDSTGTRRRPHQTRSSSLRNVAAGSTS